MLVTLALCASITVSAAAPTDPPKPSPPSDGASEAESADPYRLELSFGNSLLFLDQPLFSTAGGDAARATIPIASVVMIAEGLLTDRLSLFFFLSMPLDTKKTLAAGVIEEEPVANALALGLGYVPARFKLFRHAQVELQLGALFGRTFASHLGDRFFPMLAGRIRFVSRQGFTLYIGEAFAFGEDTLALLYGIGNRF